MGIIIVILVVWTLLAYLSLQHIGANVSGDPNYEPKWYEVLLYMIASFAVQSEIKDHYKNKGK